MEMETEEAKARIVAALEQAPGRMLSLWKLLDEAQIRRGYTTPLEELRSEGKITFARGRAGWQGDEVIILL